jgi:hypothetical protein
MNTAARIGSLAAMIIVLSCLVLGCTDPTDSTETQTNPEDIVNTDKPNSNERIVSEVVIGDEGEWSSLWEITEESAGGYYYRGGVNSRYGGGRLDATGDHVWHCRTPYSPRGMCMAGPATALPNALIMAGGYDTNDDDKRDVGQASLVTPSGTLVNLLVYTSDTSRIWFNSIVSLSDSTFIAVGGFEDPAETYYPFVAVFKLASSGQIEKQSEAVISSLPGMYFVYSALDPEESSDSETVLYVNSRPDIEALHRISLPLPDLTPSTVEWTREITVPSATGWEVNHISFFGGNLYWAGSAEDPAKDPPPSDGGYWRSGAAGSYTSAGLLRWVKLIRLTGHSDKLYEIVAHGDTLYAVGQCGNYGQEGQQFGYGWICRIDAATGTPISNMTFGDPKNSSGFNSGIHDGSVMHCVGWTHQEVGGVYQGWYCTVDIVAALMESLAIPSAPICDADRAMPGDHRSVHQDGGRPRAQF